MSSRTTTLLIALSSLVSGLLSAQDQSSPAPSGSEPALEIMTLKVVDGAVQVFQSKADAIWPGYNLAEHPVLLYRPGAWVLLVNGRAPVEGFTSVPADWPSTTRDIQFRSGPYADLQGQLGFDIGVGTRRAA